MMLEILQFYVSGFWVWIGITLGMMIITSALADMVVGFVRGFWRAWKG